MIRSTAKAAILAICLVIGQIASAAEDCEFETWLTNVYVVTATLAQEIENGQQKVNPAAAIRLLNRYPPDDLRSKMRERGLSAYEGEIAQYLQRHTSLLTTYRVRGQNAARQLSGTLASPEVLRSMRSMVSSLQCIEEPGWSATPALARLSGMSIREQAADWAIVAVGLAAATVLVLGLSALQRRTRRRTRRHPFGRQARLHALNRSGDTHVIDISLLGAKLGHHGDLAPGTPCTLTLHGLSLSARVVWSKAEACGIRFERPLSPERLDGILAQQHLEQETGGILVNAAR